MNCEKCQDLISDFLDGALNHEDEAILSSHLEECLECAGVRGDLNAIVGFCQTHRGEYAAPANAQALWQGIRNVLEAEAQEAAPISQTPTPGRGTNLKRWVGRSWELSFPQLIAAAAVIVLVVAMSTVVAFRRWQTGPLDGANAAPANGANLSVAAANVRERVSQQQEMISYWNQRVEFNKARWSSEMRETFDRNLKVIDQAVNDSFESLSRNPHDEVSEDMLHAALNEKLSLLKEFAEL
jgi:anti-sigma factor RsiW